MQIKYNISLITVSFFFLVHFTIAQDVTDFKLAWQRHERYTIELIQAMPESEFNYKPSAGSRSFVELIQHITFANYGFGSMLGEEQLPIKPDSLKMQDKTKAQIIEVLRSSFVYVIAKAEALTTESLQKSLTWGNRYESTTKRTKRQILSIIKEHAAHHRGQMTVYLRLKAIVPPEFID